MKTFDVILTRAYKVKIEAENEMDARELVEFFVGIPDDKSNKRERSQYKFIIRDIDMTLNEAFEAEEVEE